MSLRVLSSWGGDPLIRKTIHVRSLSSNVLNNILDFNDLRYMVCEGSARVLVVRRSSTESAVKGRIR